MEETRQYAIAGSYTAYMEWRRQHPGLHVSYLTRERAEQLLERGAVKGTLHRLPGWETSPAREAAERLESKAS